MMDKAAELAGDVDKLFMLPLSKKNMKLLRADHDLHIGFMCMVSFRTSYYSNSDVQQVAEAC